MAPPPVPFSLREVLGTPASILLSQPIPSKPRGQNAGLTTSSGAPHVWYPWVPGHAPALPLPHLETIDIRVSDTDTRA